MGNPRGVKRDFEALEDRRLKAAELLKKGWGQAEVAREVGVHRQSVSRWAAALESAGTRGLRATGGRGRRARLTAADLAKIEEALKRGPEVLGYETGLWTLARVAELIEQECGVHYHPGHIWKILRRMKWSVQRPVGRALERNEDNIEHWKRARWPKVKKRCPPRTNHRLHRRERAQRAAPPMPDLGTPRPSSQPPVPLQLEYPLGDRRGNLVELLLSALPRFDQSSAGHRLSWSPAATAPRSLADHLGWPARPSEPEGRSVHFEASRPPPDRAASRLRSGTQSGRVSLGLPQTPRDPESLSKKLVRAEYRSPSRPRSNPSQAMPDYSFLAPNRAVLNVTIISEAQ